MSLFDKSAESVNKILQLYYTIDQKLDTATKNVEAIRAEVVTIRSEVSALRTEIIRMEGKIAALEEGRKTFQSDIQVVKAETVSELHKIRSELLAEFHKIKNETLFEMRTAQQSREVEIIAQFLTSQTRVHPQLLSAKEEEKQTS